MWLWCKRILNVVCQAVSTHLCVDQCHLSYPSRYSYRYIFQICIFPDQEFHTIWLGGYFMALVTAQLRYLAALLLVLFNYNINETIL